MWLPYLYIFSTDMALTIMYLNTINAQMVALHTGITQDI